MVNRPKAIGTAAESAVVRWVRTQGFPHAERLALTGAKDCGDVRLTPLGWTAGIVVVEVKAHKSAGTGQPGAKLLAIWMAQARMEQRNAGAVMCPLIVKRTGTLDVGAWWAYVTAGQCATLMGISPYGIATLPHEHAPICMPVASLVAFLRFSGFGEPWGEVVA